MAPCVNSCRARSRSLCDLSRLELAEATWAVAALSCALAMGNVGVRGGLGGLRLGESRAGLMPLGDERGFGLADARLRRDERRFRLLNGDVRIDRIERHELLAPLDVLVALHEHACHAPEYLSAYDDSVALNKRVIRRGMCPRVAEVVRRVEHRTRDCDENRAEQPRPGARSRTAAR